MHFKYTYNWHTQTGKNINIWKLKNSVSPNVSTRATKIKKGMRIFFFTTTLSMCLMAMYRALFLLMRKYVLNS